MIKNTLLINYYSPASLVVLPVTSPCLNEKLNVHASITVIFPTTDSSLKPAVTEAAFLVWEGTKSYVLPKVGLLVAILQFLVATWDNKPSRMTVLKSIFFKLDASTSDVIKNRLLRIFGRPQKDNSMHANARSQKLIRVSLFERRLTNIFKYF